MTAKRRKPSSSQSSKGRPARVATRPSPKAAQASQPAPPSWGLIATAAVTATMPLVARHTIATSTAPDFSGAVGLAWFGVAIVGAFGAALVDAMRRKAIELPRSWWLAAALALLVIGTLVSAFGAEDKYAALVGTAQVVLVAVYLVTVLLVAGGRAAVAWLLAALVAGAVASAGMSAYENLPGQRAALVEYYEQHREQVLAQQGIEPGSAEEAMYRRRVEGDFLSTFHHPNLFASYLAVASLVAVGLMIGATGLGHRRTTAPTDSEVCPGPSRLRLVAALLLTPLVLGMLVVLVLTGARAAVVAAAVTGFALLVMSVRARAPKLAGALVLVVVTIVLLVVATQRDRFDSAMSSLQFRQDYWSGALMIRGHALTGVGPGNFAGHYLASKLPAAPEEINHPHNALLWAYAELGVAGLLGLVALAVAAIVLARRRPLPVTEPPQDESAILRRFVPVMLLAGLLVTAFDFAGGVGLIAERLATSVFAALQAVGGMLLPMIAVLALCQEPDECRALARRVWLRRGLIAGAVAFGLQAMVSLTVPHLPNFAQLSCVIGLLAATGDGPRWHWSLARPRRRGFVAALMLLAFAAYGMLVAWPVIGSYAAVDDAMRHAPSSREHRRLLELAAERCPVWAEPWSLMAAADWYALQQMSPPTAEATLRRSLAELEAAHRLRPRDLDTVIKMVQTAEVLAREFDDPSMAERALELRRELTELHPSKPRFWAEYAVALNAAGRTEEAGWAAHRAWRLDDMQRDPLRKLDPAMRERVDAIVQRRAAD